MAPESVLSIYLFEPLRVQLDDRSIDENYPRRRAKALFVYLYINRGRALDFQVSASRRVVAGL